MRKKKKKNKPNIQETTVPKKVDNSLLGVLCCLIKCKPPHIQSTQPTFQAALSTQFTHHILPQPVGWRRPSIMFASPELDGILLQDRVPMKLEAA